MPTIYDLSAETIEQIFRHIRPNTGYCHQRKSLQAAALVCRAWRPAAQRVLWSDMCLDQFSASRHVLGSIGRYPIDELALSNSWEETRPSPVTSGLLAMVQGVRVMTLGGGVFIDPGSLCGYNLRHLKSLTLDLVLYTPTSSNLVLPFTLTSLALSFGGGHLPTDPGGPPAVLLEALARQSSIVSLRLTTYGLEGDPYGLFIHLLPLAPQLTSLSLRMGGGQAHFVSRCTRLKSLETRGGSLLSRVAASLEDWAIYHCTHSNVRGVLDILNESRLGLTIPLRVELRMTTRPMGDGMDDATPGACRRDMKRWAEGWEDLEDLRRRSKIELIVERQGYGGF